MSEQQRREKERAAQARQRAKEQAARRQPRRSESSSGRSPRRRASSCVRKPERAAWRRVAEAELMTEAVRAKVAAFERLLHDRSRRLAAHSRQAEDAFNARGPEAFVDAIQRALATSVYPDGLDGSCAAQYIPESRELWVEYELLISLPELPPGWDRTDIS